MILPSDDITLLIKFSEISENTSSFLLQEHKTTKANKMKK